MAVYIDDIIVWGATEKNMMKEYTYIIINFIRINNYMYMVLIKHYAQNYNMYLESLAHIELHLYGQQCVLKQRQINYLKN